MKVLLFTVLLLNCLVGFAQEEPELELSFDKKVADQTKTPTKGQKPQLDFFNIKKNCALEVVKKWRHCAPGGQQQQQQQQQQGQGQGQGQSQLDEVPIAVWNFNLTVDGTKSVLHNKPSAKCTDKIKYGQCGVIAEDVVNPPVFTDSKYDQVDFVYDATTYPSSRYYCCGTAEFSPAGMPKDEITVIDTDTTCDGTEDHAPHEFEFHNKPTFGTLIVCKNSLTLTFSEGRAKHVCNHDAPLKGFRYKITCKHPAIPDRILYANTHNNGCTRCIGPILTGSVCTAQEIKVPHPWLPMRPKSLGSLYDGVQSSKSVLIPRLEEDKNMQVGPVKIGEVPHYVWTGDWQKKACPTRTDIPVFRFCNAHKPVCLTVEKCEVKSDARNAYGEDTCRSSKGDRSMKDVSFTVNVYLDAKQTQDITSSASYLDNKGKKNALTSPLTTDKNGKIRLVDIPFGATVKVCEDRQSVPAFRTPDATVAAGASLCGEKDRYCCKVVTLDSESDICSYTTSNVKVLKLDDDNVDMDDLPADEVAKDAEVAEDQLEDVADVSEDDASQGIQARRLLSTESSRMMSFFATN